MERQRAPINIDYLDKLLNLRSTDSWKQKLVDFCTKVIETKDIQKIQWLLVYLQEIGQQLWWKDNEIFTMIFGLQRQINIIKDGYQAENLAGVLDIDLSKYLQWYEWYNIEVLKKNVTKYYWYCQEKKTFDSLQKFYDKIIDDAQKYRKEIKSFYVTLSIVDKILKDTKIYEKNGSISFPIAVMLMQSKKVVELLEQEEETTSLKSPLKPSVDLVFRDRAWDRSGDVVPCLVPQDSVELDSIEEKLKSFFESLKNELKNIAGGLLKIWDWKESGWEVNLDRSWYDYWLRSFWFSVKFGFNLRKTGICYQGCSDFARISDTGFFYVFDVLFQKCKFVINSDDLKQKFKFENKYLYAQEMLKLWHFINFCICMQNQNKSQKRLKKFFSNRKNPFNTSMLKINFPNLNKNGINKVEKLLKDLYTGNIKGYVL